MFRSGRRIARHSLSLSLSLGAGLLAALTAAGCLHAPAPAAATTTTTTTAPSARPLPPADAPLPRPEARRAALHDARFLGAAELSSVTTGATVYDAVLRFRPEFLRRRSPSFEQPGGHLPQVYIDDLYQGDLESLRTLRATAISHVRFLTPPEAIQRFGTLRDLRGGVILVTTGKR